MLSSLNVKQNQRKWKIRTGNLISKNGFILERHTHTLKKNLIQPKQEFVVSL